jgi:hypothetical protein
LCPGEIAGEIHMHGGITRHSSRTAHYRRGRKLIFPGVEQVPESDSELPISGNRLGRFAFAKSGCRNGRRRYAMDQSSTRAHASDLAIPVDANRRFLQSIWWRWLGPTSVLIVGSAFFILALTREPPPAIFVPLCGLAALAPAAEAPFLTENDTAMRKMMMDMTIQPTGDVDHDFVAMMVPHHQGAIEMAQALLRHGHNEALRRMAQEIIVTQQQEIAAMRLALDQPLPPSVPSPDQPGAAASPDAHLTSQQ